MFTDKEIIPTEIDNWPQNHGAECALLGALLVDNKSYDAVSDIIKPAFFYTPLHGRIYESIQKLCDGGGSATPDIIGSRFVDDPDLREYPEPARYLKDLAANVVNTSNSRQYAEIIRDLHLERNLLAASAGIYHSTKQNDDDVTVMELLERAEAEIYKIGEYDRGQDGPQPVRSGVDGALKFMEMIKRGDIVGAPTLIPSLDKKLGAMMNGELITLAGRPGMGKTAMALTAAYNLAKSGEPVLFFSLEMSKEQLSMRLLARETGISTHVMRDAQYLTDENWDEMIKSTAVINNSNIHIDDGSALTVGQMRSRARRFKRMSGLSLIVIDYLGFVKPDDDRAMPVAQISQITRDIKAMAKELGVPVLLLAQLNRGVEARENKRPMLSDLRDSGSIEQDSDMVLFVYRGEYYEARNEPEIKESETEAAFNDRYARWQDKLSNLQGRAEVIIAKFRQGKPSTVHMHYDGPKLMFFDKEANDG